MGFEHPHLCDARAAGAPYLGFFFHGIDGGVFWRTCIGPIPLRRRVVFGRSRLRSLCSISTRCRDGRTCLPKSVVRDTREHNCCGLHKCQPRSPATGAQPVRPSFPSSPRAAWCSLGPKAGSERSCRRCSHRRPQRPRAGRALLHRKDLDLHRERRSCLQACARGRRASAGNRFDAGTRATRSLARRIDHLAHSGRGRLSTRLETETMRDQARRQVLAPVVHALDMHALRT